MMVLIENRCSSLPAPRGVQGKRESQDRKLKKSPIKMHSMDIAFNECIMAVQNAALENREQACRMID